MENRREKIRNLEDQSRKSNSTLKNSEQEIIREGIWEILPEPKQEVSKSKGPPVVPSTTMSKIYSVAHKPDI